MSPWFLLSGSILSTPTLYFLHTMCGIIPYSWKMKYDSALLLFGYDIENMYLAMGFDGVAFLGTLQADLSLSGVTDTSRIPLRGVVYFRPCGKLCPSHRSGPPFDINSRDIEEAVTPNKKTLWRKTRCEYLYKEPLPDYCTLNHMRRHPVTSAAHSSDSEEVKDSTFW